MYILRYERKANRYWTPKDKTLELDKKDKALDADIKYNTSE